MITMALLVGAILWAALGILAASFAGRGWVRPPRRPTPADATSAVPVPSAVPTPSGVPIPGTEPVASADATSPGAAMAAYGMGRLRLDGLARTPHDRKVARLVLVTMGLVPVVLGVWVLRTSTFPVGGGAALVIGLAMIFVWSRRATR